MNNKAEQLYQSMLTDLLYCQQKELNQEEETECCFQIATKYWGILKNEVANYEFETISEEIYFFKKIKPLFIAEIEYYGLVYHAQLFKKNITNTNQLEEFWKREGDRLLKFKKEKRNFYKYYKKRDTKNDKKWFLRTYNDQSNFRITSIYYLDVNVSTSHDYLVSRLIALERYFEYVKKELEGIKTD